MNAGAAPATTAADCARALLDLVRPLDLDHALDRDRARALASERDLDRVLRDLAFDCSLASKRARNLRLRHGIHPRVHAGASHPALELERDRILNGLALDRKLRKELIRVCYRLAQDQASTWAGQASTRLLMLAAGLLQVEDRARFIEEYSPDPELSRWARAVWLVEMLAEMPRTAWVYRQRRRDPIR